MTITGSEISGNESGHRRRYPLDRREVRRRGRPRSRQHRRRRRGERRHHRIDGGPSPTTSPTLGGGVFSSGAQVRGGTGGLVADDADASATPRSPGTARSGRRRHVQQVQRHDDHRLDDHRQRGVGNLRGSAPSRPSLDVSGSQFTDNYAQEFAGAVAVGKYSTLDMASSQVSGNFAGYGAGIVFGCGCATPKSAPPAAPARSPGRRSPTTRRSTGPGDSPSATSARPSP